MNQKHNNTLLNKYKIFFFDLDGTLLNSNKVVSVLNKKAIFRLQELNKVVSVATGRSALNNALKYAQEIVHPKVKKNLNQHLICLNGAEIVDIHKNKIVENQIISADNARKVLDYMQAAGWLTIVYAKDETNINRRNLVARAIVHKEITNELVYSARWKADKPVKKITAHILQKFDQHVNELEKRFSDCISIIRHGTTKFYQIIEITAKNVSKKTAAEIVCDLHKTSLEHAVSFGDSKNDLPLLMASGYSISFADSVPGVKEKAKYVACDSNEDGVGKSIYDLFLS